MSDTPETIPSFFDRPHDEDPDDVLHIDAINPRVVGTGPDARLLFELSLSDVGNARQGRGSRSGTGFVVNPIEFTVNGRMYVLTVGWVRISVKRGGSR